MHCQLDLVAAIDLGEVDAHVIAGRGRYVLSHEVRADRKLAMTTVDEDREAYRARAPVIHESVHCRADGATGEEHVVDEHDDTVVDGEGDLRLAHHRCVTDARQVVAIQGDIDRAEREIDAFVQTDGVADAGGERVAARADADDGEEREITVPLDDLVRDPRDCPADVVA